MITFEQRAGDMGLSNDPQKGLFLYADDLSRVVYRSLVTRQSNGVDPIHMTDNYQVPYYAVFTQPVNDGVPRDADWIYTGCVSRIYRFVGNRDLINGVRESIEAVGIPIVRENNIMTFDYSRIRSEIIIQSGVESPQVGDVLPVMIINNSYNGTRAQSIQFGIAVNYQGDRLVYGFHLGEMREVHVAGAQTYVSSSAQDYVQNFPQHITEMITESFNKKLTEDELFSTLDVIQNIGKKRRDEISKILSDMMPEVQEGQDPQLPSAWQVFLAIVRYSSFESNLNARTLLEDAAQSVLVIPTRMMEMLARLEASAQG